MLISSAYAQAATPAAGSGIMDFLPLVVLFVVFYLLILRPQQKRAKEHKIMLEALQKGDEVLTAGGILGRASKVGETYIAVEIADGVTVNTQKASIQAVLPKGTIKSI